MPTTTNAQTANEELDWDDDDFEPAEIELKTDHGLAQQSSDDDTAKEEESKDEKDEWLTPLKRHEKGPKPTDNTKNKQEYLTKQFLACQLPLLGKSRGVLIAHDPLSGALGSAQNARIKQSTPQQEDKMKDSIK